MAVPPHLQRLLAGCGRMPRRSRRKVEVATIDSDGQPLSQSAIRRMKRYGSDILPLSAESMSCCSFLNSRLAIVDPLLHTPHCDQCSPVWHNCQLQSCTSIQHCIQSAGSLANAYLKAGPLTFPPVLQRRRSPVLPPHVLHQAYTPKKWHIARLV